MRLTLILSLIALTGICFAQDTSFSAGPQYLIPPGSGMLRPITTPSRSFSSAPEDPYVGSSEIAPGIISSSLVPPPSQTFLGGVYWGEHMGSEIVAHRVETPSLTAQESNFYTYATANLASGPPASAPAEVVEIPLTPSAESPSANSANSSTSMNQGTSNSVGAESIPDNAYGASLGEVAAFWKLHKRAAHRLLTNQEAHQAGGRRRRDRLS